MNTTIASVRADSIEIGDTIEIEGPAYPKPLLRTIAAVATDAGWTKLTFTNGEAWTPRDDRLVTVVREARSAITAPEPIVLAIADEDDFLANITASDLIDALMLATDRLGVIEAGDDEAAQALSIDTAEDAHAMRDRLLATLTAVNGAM